MSTKTNVIVVCDHCEKNKPKRQKGGWIELSVGSAVLDFCCHKCLVAYNAPGGNGYIEEE